MIDENQIVNVKWGHKNQRRYIEAGYQPVPYGEYLQIELKNVIGTPQTYIEVTCDYCNTKYQTLLSNYRKTHKDGKKDCCKNCIGQKISTIKKSQRLEVGSRIFKRVENKLKECGCTLLTSPNDYENVDMLFDYLCPIHGKQTTSIKYFYHVLGCPQCIMEEKKKNRRFSPDEVQKIIEESGENKLLNKNDYTRNCDCNLKITCPCGEIFTTSLSSYKDGKTRCRRCSKTESNGEYRIRKYLQCNNIAFIPQYYFQDCRDKYVLPFDFYLPEYNVCIEFDGEQHFRPAFGNEGFEKTVKHDKIKNDYCSLKQIGLLRIRYDDYDNIEQIITEYLLTCKRYSLIS